MMHLAPDKIDLHMGWRSESLQKYYIRDYILTDPNGPAVQLAGVAREGLLNDFQLDMFNPVNEKLHSVKFN